MTLALSGLKRVQGVTVRLDNISHPTCWEEARALDRHRDPHMSDQALEVPFPWE